VLLEFLRLIDDTINEVGERLLLFSSQDYTRFFVRVVLEADRSDLFCSQI
jgi:hypothetical protein